MVDSERVRLIVSEQKKSRALTATRCWPNFLWRLERPQTPPVTQPPHLLQVAVETRVLLIVRVVQQELPDLQLKDGHGKVLREC